jgi:hypothetical protein
VSAWIRCSGAAVAGAVTVLALSACGGSAGGDATGAGAVHGRFPVAVSVHFPTAQRLALRTRLRIAVRNTGHRALPDVAVTICERSCAASARANEGTAAQPFGYDIRPAANTADPSRPVWIVNRAPGGCHAGCNASGGEAGGAVTAASNTWTLGRLAPGHTARFEWALTPVVAGRHVVAWQVAGDITGAARAVAGGTIPRGTLAVTVGSRPPHLHVTPSGKVETTSG